MNARLKVRRVVPLAIVSALAFGAPVDFGMAAERMTANYPTLTTGAALAAARAALALCAKQGYTVAVAVVDRGGLPLVMLRDNLAGAHTSNTAIRKAYTAASFRTATRDLADTTQPGKPASGIRQIPDVIAVSGGIVIDARGSLVGAIGVSGAPNGDADDACAKAGAGEIKDALELE